ncbi:unnamed protein product [Microthlaspi erraticum]|uniref:Protein kinase domain-containing protein n=1 Tax=Microthlaspi erraticum TaxID=1685480 RepID=A0A6D2KTZ3_9BRAS|nr:unnamed protein product [Microthlaspi erraticum]
MICHALLIFFTLVSAVSVVDGARAAYTATDVFLFNCGQNNIMVDSSGREWTAENLEIPSVNASFSSTASPQYSDVPQVPYMTARIFRSDFTYSFPVSPGWKFIRLYFYPTRYGSGFDAVSSFFSVNVNGFTLLKNFSADLTVKASNNKTVLIKEFIVPVSVKLNLTFTPSPKSLAFVNGIEILSMPDRFYSKGGFDDVISNVGSSVNFEIHNSTAFETVYRINVAGQTIKDVNDTGMFRWWLSDIDFILGVNSGLEPYVPYVKINYTKKTPAYVAPEDVYTTYRTMGNVDDPKLNLNFNLTWLFTVDAGFNYLVRLHFCETLQEVSLPGERVFTIFIGNHVAKLDMDVIQLSGGSRIPMYLDFNVYVDSTDLRLDLHPLKDIAPKFYDAILNGVEILKQSDFDGNLAGPNPSPIQNSVMQEAIQKRKKKSHVLVTILEVVGSSIGLGTFIIVLILLMRHMKSKKRRKEHNGVMFKVLIKQYTYAQVKKITKSFSQKIGKGGFGTVYEGSLSNGCKVAVKVLKDLKGNGEDFINEVASMSQTSHVNIVSLLGFCYEGSRRAIVYEFLENGSLDQFMSRKRPLTLDVTTQYGIALGVARGLEYLHYGCKTRIVHFDIKPQNILLDGNLCPKVSDFGLAKLCEKRESVMSLIDTRGTIGYIAPEVFSRMYGGISHKSDVYSYGMLVLEMIGARNKEIFEARASSASTVYFPDWIYMDLENGEQTWILGDEVTNEEKEIAKKMVLVSLWCIQPCPSDRPPMNRVVEMIEGSLDALDLPPKPSMHISTGLIIESSSLPNVSAVSVLQRATAAYTPADVFLVGCGATSYNVSSSGRNWTAESQEIMSSNSDKASFSWVASFIGPGVPLVPYTTARIFRSDFTYSFPVSPGWKFIRLYFYPGGYNISGDFDDANSFFSVTTNGYNLLKNFSADQTVKASSNPVLVKEFIVPVNQTLNLTFRPSPNSLAFVNGIEIVSMPDRFYSKGGFDDVISNVGSSVNFLIDNSTAFETVYRINVAGQNISDSGDKGMFRRWLSDDAFILRVNPGLKPDVLDVKIKYTEKTPAYVAPDNVYTTSRTMGNAANPKLNLNSNLTWLFPVDAGFNYLLRLHFCETLREVSFPGERVFSIFIGNQVAKLDMDVIQLSGGSRIPIYLDFSVFVGLENESRADLRLDLHPFKDIAPKYYDAILNGVEILKMNEFEGSLDGPNGFSNPKREPTNSEGNLVRPKRKPNMLGGKLNVLMIVVGSAFGLVTSVVILILLMRQMKRKKRRKENSGVMFKVLIKQYTYAQVGRGGFGTVYEANLPNGCKVAVKVLKDLKGNGEDFINEVASMSQTSHVNIVSLLGFCYEGSKRAIVYEFLENGSLDQFISRQRPMTLDVRTQYGIALGVARGLEYLHYGCKTRIVHFDIKPQNILLDGNLCPKVSDFGLAKLCEKRESVMSLIDTRGTIGYIAPEVFSSMYGGVSHKSDVYSYGMLVLEMIGARNKERFENTASDTRTSSHFPDWIYKDLENGEQTWILGDEVTDEEKEIAKKMVLVSLWCIQPCPSDRPPMNRVVEMIEGSLDALSFPPKPSMHISTGLTLESSSLPNGE